MGRDGSTGDIRMGRDFVCVSLVGAACREALPVYVKLGRGGVAFRRRFLVYYTPIRPWWAG